MRKKILITAVVALLTLIMILMLIPLLEKEEVIKFIQRNISTPQSEIELACPQMLAVYYFMDTKKTTSLKDDDVFIVILNTQNKSYNAEVFVDGISQGKTIITKNSTTTLNSELITEWWRQGIKEPQTTTQEREDSTEEEIHNQKIFYIDILIEGCNKSISALTPTLPAVESKSLTGGTLGGAASRYSIDISKTQSQYMPD